MATLRPVNGETVWIEFPEGKHFEAVYDTKVDAFTSRDGQSISAKHVANWARQEHEDTDISDDPTERIKGKLARS